MPGGEAVSYHFIEGTGLNKSLAGGIMQRMDATPSPGGPVRGCTMTFEVSDCDERYKWATNNGGAEALPPQDYPGVGRCAYVEDGEGNIVGIFTPEANKDQAVKADDAFVGEFSKASSLSVTQIQEVVRALRNWESN